MTLTYFSCGQGLDLCGDNEKGHESDDGVHLSVSAHSGMCAWSCVVHQYQEAEPPASLPPNSAFHHHWSVPSIKSHVCPQSISISRLCTAISLSLHSPFFIFHITPMCIPRLPPSLPPMLLPHTLRSRGSLPPRWFVNSSLRRNQYYINKPQRAFALILYDLCGKGLRASISSSGLLPELCC